MTVNKTTLMNMVNFQKIAFIASLDDGVPVTKAMLKPRKVVDLKEFYFTTNTSSQRVQQYYADSTASLYFCDQRFFRGVLFKGQMEVLTDEATKAMIWNDGDEMYYKLGVTDPDYCVLRFTASSGRYYNNFSSQDFTIESLIEGDNEHS